MNVQILGLRKFHDKQKNHDVMYNAFFKEKWRAESVAHLFKSVDSYLSVIPTHEQFNLYYTVANCEEKKGRIFSHQSVIPFDIDGIDIELREDYIDPICEVLKVARNEIGIIFSGNGLQFIVGLLKPFNNVNYFKETKLLYKAVCKKIDDKLQEKGLPGSADPVVWSKGRLMRLPKTLNRKPGKQDRMGELYNDDIKPLDFSLESIIDIPILSSHEHLTEYPPPDGKAILTECAFLRFCNEFPRDVNEAEWYAMIGIVARFDREKVHLMSNAHPGYNVDECEEKIEHALIASGPRTCKNVESLFHGCKKCAYYNKVKSPILIKSKDFIATEKHGFTTRKQNARIRHYDDLLKFFIKKYHYKYIDEIDELVVFTGTHYEPFRVMQIKSFAEEHFEKPVNERERIEFKKKLEVHNLKPLAWYQTPPDGLVNFKNGVLDLKTKILMKHSYKYNFFYCLPYEYNPEAICPAWHNFIQDVTLDRKRLIDVLHEFMGYCVTGGEYIYHNALILSGQGKNGKSTFLHVLEGLVGEANTSHISLSSIASDKFASSNLSGKLLNISEEEPPGCFRETGSFKNLTGNSVVSAQRKFKPGFNMLSRAKIAISYNELPHVSDKSTGMRRRLLIVPFDLKLNETPKKIDDELKVKLSKQLSGIFNMALQGWERLKSQRDFTKSEFINSEVEDIFDRADTFKMWVEMKVDITGDKNDRVKAVDAYNNYIDLMTRIEEKSPLNRYQFTAELKYFGLRVKPIHINGKTQRGFCGAKVNDEADY